MSPELTSFQRSIQFAGLKTFTSRDSVYQENTVPWSLSYDASPALLLIPDSISQLQTAIRNLYATSLDFTVRGRGCGSASAKDVLISLSAPAFQNISLVSATESEGPVIDVAAGCDWSAVDAFVEENLPGHAIVGARCPYVGLAGSTLTGGLSWLSHEFGLSSDPSNLLDVQIVLWDGSLVRARTHDPQLLWALRGGGGNFGVVSTLRFRARRHPGRVFGGIVFLPEESLREVSRAVARWTNEVQDEKMALHFFVMDANPDMALHGGSAVPSLVALPFDARGEVHGRSKEGFGWLFDIPGMKEGEGVNRPREMSLREVHEMQRGGQSTHGKGCSWLQAALVGEGPDGRLDDEFMVRCWEWYMMIVHDYPDLATGSFVLLEVMQRAAFTSAGDPSATGWPHGGKGRQHVLQLSTGCKPLKGPELTAMQDKALKLLGEAPARMTGKNKHPDGDFLPNFLLPNHDLGAIFGANWEKLRTVKSMYDPRARFETNLVFPPR
ncbi:MAG: hypothetical protein Q9159_007709 [Coniocarpon cinnabarinum]